MTRKSNNDESYADPVIRKKSYVEIVNTDDEWENLIGLVEEFYTESGDLCTYDDPLAFFVQVRFPTNRTEQKQMLLFGVNHFTGYVLYELRNSDDIKLVNIKNLEYINSEDL